MVMAPFVLGETFSIAEAATAPIAMRLALVLPGLRPSLDTPLQWCEEDGLPRVARWMDAVCARPSCMETLPPPAELQASYKRMLERFASMAK